MIELRVLGEAELRDGGRGDLDSVLAQPKRLAILTYLCLAGRGGYVRRDTLVALFWPEFDEERARAALNQSVYVLRRALGPEVLPGRGVEEIRVDLSKLTCDALSFRLSLESDDPAGALDLYVGDLLPALHVDSPDFVLWLDEERASLRNAAASAALELAAQAEAGDPPTATEWYRRALQIVPESESAARGLVSTLWRTGHRTAALEAFERFAGHLAGEYSVAPGSALLDLVEQIREGARSSDIGSGDPDTVSLTGGVATAQIAPPLAAKKAKTTVRAWIRVLLPFGLGIATIVLIATWLGSSRLRDDGAWYHANQEYLKAWAAWDSGRIDSARILLRRAVELDSTHARAWALLACAEAYLNALDLGKPTDLLPSAYEAAQRAVQLGGDTLAAPWAAHAVTRWTYRREWEGAERDYRHAVSLSPGGRWEALSRIDLSALLENLGRCEEAREVLEPYAAEDPRDRIFGSSVVVRLPYMCRDYGAAIAEAERVIESGDSSFRVRQYLFLARLEAGDLEGADVELHALREASPGQPLQQFNEALFAARSGEVAEARQIISQLSRLSTDGVFGSEIRVLRAESLAQLHAAVGDLDDAFAVLSNAFENKGHVRRLSSHPLFEPLRGDPRYEALLARMGLRCRREGDRHTCRPLE